MYTGACLIHKSSLDTFCILESWWILNFYVRSNKSICISRIQSSLDGGREREVERKSGRFMFRGHWPIRREISEVGN